MQQMNHYFAKIYHSFWGTFLQIFFCFNGNINPVIILLEIDGCLYFVENYKNEQWILHIVICMILSE